MTQMESIYYSANMAHACGGVKFGARLCEPQRVDGNGTWNLSSVLVLPATRSGSQTRAPATGAVRGCAAPPVPSFPFEPVACPRYDGGR
jgi:hypothetical protein